MSDIHDLDLPEVGKIYRHFKGNTYEVTAIAQHSETLEYMIVYQETHSNGKSWVRPASMWFDEVSDRPDRSQRRFVAL